ncbi:MAG: FtsX-like permease family protein [Candidatus Thorarchaeota archaeon]|nr:FtsX-like permease family protein [Candidatus Thorarchaeota archaeon]
MAKKKNTKDILKGNRLWSIGYALVSLKHNPTRNIGIALVLAISIALPTTVFSWTNTGTILAVEDYFNNNAYQFSVQSSPGDIDYTHLFDAQNLIMASPFTRYAHVVPSTVGLLRIDGTTPEWEVYYTGSLNYALGLKDTRVITVTPEILDVWSTELVWEGNFSLNPGEILVSQRFIDTALQVTGGSVEIGLGSEIGIDVLCNRYIPRSGQPFDPLELERQIVRNLTIVGVYQIVRSSIVGQSFPEIYRRNWDPMGMAESVLGISDSVLMLQDELPEDSIDTMINNGFFSPVCFVRGSSDGLIAAGPFAAAFNMQSLSIQVEESDQTLTVVTLGSIENLQTHINTYAASQVLIILGLPIMIMSLMLTIFTSETSVSQRKGEISALRSKGASFNQIFSAFIWESLILSLSGFIIGLSFTLLMAPLMGSSTGLLSIDPIKYELFVSRFALPGEAITLAAIIALFLPAAYLFHVSRRIDITEIGQPTIRQTYEVPEEVGFTVYAVGLAVVLAILVLVPLLVAPNGQNALYEILLSTLLLFASAYLGSRAMRLITAEASEKITRIMGEKRLYLTQSLRRRKGQFIPLLVVLTLTLTTTTMMLIQTASFENTLINEANYSLGSDIRIQTPEQDFDWIDSLPSSTLIDGATPVIEALSHVGTEGFYLEGIDAAVYRDIGNFKSTSFVGGTPESILSELDITPNGIVISQYYASSWNLTIDMTVPIEVLTDSGNELVVFQVVGIMQSAPGFGMASTRDLYGTPFGSYFDFQPGLGGFALVNLDFLRIRTGIETSETFFVGVSSLLDVAPMIDYLESQVYTDVYTTDNIEFSPDSVTGLFLAGLQGLTMIGFILCAAMGIASIALFLGSAVIEREPEYALFRAIGGTKKQVISLVFGEFAGSVLAAVLISLVLGIIFGYTATLLTFGISTVWPILPKILTYPLFAMLLTVALECAVMIIACYYPARRAGNTNPAEVLRNM